MALIPIKNESALDIYVGCTMIPAGETRHVEEWMVPAHLQPKPAEPEAPRPPADPIAELRAKTVKDIAAALPGLTVEQLKALEDAEVATGKDARKTVLGAIAQERLLRGEIAETLKMAEADLIKGAPVFEDALLPRLRAAEAAADQPRVPLLAALDAEIKLRETE